MISRYRLMRGLLKRKVVRRLAWQIIKLAKRQKFQKFTEDLARTQRTPYVAFEPSDVARIVDGLEAYGAVSGPALPTSAVEYLVDYATRTPCYADRNPSQGFYLADRDKAEAELGKPLLLAQYFNVQRDQRIHDLSMDPFLLSVAARYLGAPPQLMSVNMWWTFPVKASDEDKAKHAHVFHFDLDDVKFVKFFFYLTDVDEGAGPHVYVKGSNKDIKYKTPLLKSRRFSDAEVIEAYGQESVIEVLGEAGACLIEDTITLHKGITPTVTPRLILQFEYSINTYPEISCVVADAEQRIFV